jgi:hypothetical protein
MALGRTLAALTLAAAVSLAAAAPAAFAGPIVPASGVYLGAFANQPGGITSLETAIGRHLAVDRTYVPWTFTGWANRIAPDKAVGRIPELAWSAAPTTTAPAIAAGSQDGLIRAAARALRNTRVQVMLVPWYEFDQRAATSASSAGLKRVGAAWRHMVGLFRAVGATNVPLRVDADGV